MTGFLLIFLEGNVYIIEVYGTYLSISLDQICSADDQTASQASSAIAINTSVRSLFAVAFSAFARDMYVGLEPHWAGTILALLATVFSLVPPLFFKYGVKLRAMSKWTPKLSPGPGSSPTEGYPERKL